MTEIVDKISICNVIVELRRGRVRIVVVEYRGIGIKFRLVERRCPSGIYSVNVLRVTVSSEVHAKITTVQTQAETFGVEVVDALSPELDLLMDNF